LRHPRPVTPERMVPMPNILITCQHCGTQKWFPPSRVHRKFCSNLCHSESRRPPLVGKRFGNLTVVEWVRRPDASQLNGYWVCRCDCGTTRRLRTNELLQKTAGMRCKLCRQRLSEKHASIEYRTWRAMKQRCEYPKHRAYPRYGGRGIKVCDRWQSYDAFLADMGPRPSPKHSIERRDNNGDYEPDNCVWATHREQVLNRRGAVLCTYNGRTQPLSLWADETGIPYGRLYDRLKKNWPVEQAFTQPPRGSGEGRTSR
jgi:hypothetical protein